ncbi:hypothetical protein HPB51_009255 [Rhipicephalus microplus]|uniref:45 kDa calcium-binding protein n=1 Tax=Rhipicephalus microplus TaxID=6941 RepID=A0A9J6F0G5_RHIMP|nr:hypothetical protein HPB51_009255 [Rhipicephalus microplus]
MKAARLVVFDSVIDKTRCGCNSRSSRLGLEPIRRQNCNVASEEYHCHPLATLRRRIHVMALGGLPWLESRCTAACSVKAPETFKRHSLEPRIVDINNDGRLTTSELENWIAAKVKEHYTQAVRDNFWIFSALDKNHDGRVSWEEYHVNFMIEKGFDDKYAKNHPEDHKTLDRDLKEKILLDKAMWFEAANSDPDALNIDEFLTFRHPEHSHVSLIKMVNDIISNLDENGDEQLSEDEFSQLGPDDMKRTTKEEWKKERIQEFRQNIDLNGDGQASRQELLMYNDPENPIHARSEARELVQQADNNGDNQLSLEEVLSQKDVFLGILRSSFHETCLSKHYALSPYTMLAHNGSLKHQKSKADL